MNARSYNSDFIFLGTNRLPHCNPYLESGGGWLSSYTSDINGNITFDVIEDEANAELLFENNKILLFGENGPAEYMIQTINNNGWITVTASPTNPSDLISSPNERIPGTFRFYFRQSCPILEHYYTNEVIRIRLYTSYSNTLVSSNITNYSRIKVFGNPLLKISFFTNNGTMLKYAKYSEKYSTGDYFEFHYPIESMDIGQFAIGDYTGFTYPSRDQDIFAYTQESETDYLYIDYEISGTPHSSKYFSSQTAFSSTGFTRVNGQSVSNSSDGSSIATSRVRINTETTTPLLPGQFTIILKRSATPGKVPTKDDLLSGELAMNTVDGKIFAKKADDEIITVGQSVIEYASENNFPAIGQSNVIYIAADSNKLYRWHEDEYYIQVSSIEPQIFSVGSYTISATQNNFNIDDYSTVRITATSAGLGITGFQAGQDGEIRLIYNGGNHAIDIAHDSALSSNGNKVLTYDSQTFSLGVNAGVTILYDSSYNSNTGAWRLF